MIEKASMMSVVALGLTAFILVFKFIAGINDSRAKAKAKLEQDKKDLAKEGKDAFKNNDRGAIVNFLRKLRGSK